MGQHFLHDAHYRARIVDELALQATDVVIEIGPGRGAMTSLLAQRSRRVIAIEIDGALAQALQEEFGHDDRVEIVQADVLGADLSAFCRKEGVAQAYVFGNIPYYITSPLLHFLFAQRNVIRAMGLLMQREVAERLTAAPGGREDGYLTIAAQTYSQPHIALRVPPGAFSPVPRVESALVTFRMQAKFERWPQSQYDAFLEFAKRCFAQKRKNLLNNLGGIYPRTQLVKALDEVGEPPNSRAEQLSVEQLAGLFERLAPARN